MDSKPRVVVVGFSQPVILALEQLFSMGHTTDDVRVVTYEEGAQETADNANLLAFLEERGVSYVTDDIQEESVQEWLLEFDPDILFTLYYFSKVPMSLLDEMEYGGVNLHPAPLPDYRGTFSTAWAIINDDDEFGYAYHYMDAEFDTGDIVLQDTVSIEPDDTSYSLYHRTRYAGSRRFREVYELVVDKEVPGEPQSEGTYYPRELPHDGTIDTAWEDEYVDRFIRAMYFPPYEPATVEIDGEEHTVRTLSAYKSLVDQQ